MTGDKNKIIAYLTNQKEGLLFDIAPHKEKRSLNQNSYYWKLVGMIAQKQSKDGITSAMIHNRNLRELGLVERVDGSLIPIYIPDTDKAEKEALNAETYHIRPTSKTMIGKDGELYRCYVMLRGSHTFNVKEMTALLNLAVQDAKALDIETLTPAELEHMKQLEEQAEQRKGKKNNDTV